MATQAVRAGTAPARAADGGRGAPPDALPAPAVPRARVHRVHRLHRPGNFATNVAAGCEVRLSAALGRRRREPDGDGDPDAVGEARDRHRQEPARGLPGELLAPVVGAALDPGRGDRDGHRPGGVPRRRDRLQPADRDEPLRLLHHHGGRRVHAALAPALRLPALRGGDRDVPRLDRPLLPDRDLLRASGCVRGGERPGAVVQRVGVGAARGRDPRRDRDAARDLPALGADPGPDRPRVEGERGGC